MKMRTRVTMLKLRAILWKLSKCDGSTKLEVKRSPALDSNQVFVHHNIKRFSPMGRAIPLKATLNNPWGTEVLMLQKWLDLSLSQLEKCLVRNGSVLPWQFVLKMDMST